jgi:CRP/FNR family cyclic AMP-dependent transcriptional regulator
MSGRKLWSSSAPRKGPAHPGRPEVEPSSRVPPGCPSFVADPAFREVASERTYGRNSTIARQGDPARYAYVLRRGLVQVACVMPNGKSFVDLMGAGSIFGIPWIMAGLPHGFALTAVAECEIYQVEAPQLLRYLEHHAAAALELLRHLCRQEIQVMENMLHLATRVPSGERLMSALIELGRIYGVPAESGLRIPVPLTVQMLADKIGCSRQWASRLLSELEAAGKLKRNRSWITLVNGTGR